MTKHSAPIASLLLAAEAAAIADIILILTEFRLPQMLRPAALAGAALAVFLVTLRLSRSRAGARAVRRAAAVVLLAALVAQAGLFAAWRAFSTGAVYDEVDTGKAGLYGGQRVLLIAPHEDDDINLLGGVMEEYLHYGSELWVAFMTNGDRYGKGEIRLREALNLYAALGVPEDHVVFLGYGDRWSPGGPHLYNAAPGQVQSSYIGRTETYGLPGHPAFRDGQSYTSDHLIADMRDLILECRPDVIFCVDCDRHPDHRATSMAFEKAMGQVLNSAAAYTPRVYKGFAYVTAWNGLRDFYADNILSSRIGNEQKKALGIYSWKARTRFPVRAGCLSRSLLSAGLYGALAFYPSQDAAKNAERIINGDKVFWQRRTDSLCRGARIEVSSGDGARLNDFMLLDCDNLADPARMPVDGAWVPDASDSLRQIRVTFAAPADVRSVALYGGVHRADNVLNARLRFDDGTEIETGALHANGTATVIPVEVSGVNGFELTLLETSGPEAGLTEIEAFGDPADPGVGYVKLMDESEDFAYDYWTPASGEAVFLPYTWGSAPAVGAETYVLSVDNPRCAAAFGDGRIAVRCPKGERCVVSLTSSDGTYSDAVRVSNPARTTRLFRTLMAPLDRLENALLRRFRFRGFTAPRGRNAA